jgi:ArsR family transcriptional regulator, arsenate/arsenite/antimonite-responsive transcriptional repressor
VEQTTTCCAPLVTGIDEPGLRLTADRLKAIGNPVRLRILHILAASDGPVCACDVEAHFDLSQPTISHHLRVLKRAGLIESEARSPWVYFSINKGATSDLSRRLSDLT